MPTTRPRSASHDSLFQRTAPTLQLNGKAMDSGLPPTIQEFMLQPPQRFDPVTGWLVFDEPAASPPGSPGPSDHADVSAAEAEEIKAALSQAQAQVQARARSTAQTRLDEEVHC